MTHRAHARRSSSAKSRRRALVLRGDAQDDVGRDASTNARSTRTASARARARCERLKPEESSGADVHWRADAGGEGVREAEDGEGIEGGLT